MSGSTYDKGLLAQNIDQQSYDGYSKFMQDSLLDKLSRDNSILGQANSFLDDNSSLLGLAGTIFDGWNSSQDRKEKKRINDFAMEDAKSRLKMTQKAYNNELYRSDRIAGQMNGGHSSGVGQRQYVGPADTQPGYAGTQANASANVPHQAGLVSGPSNYNATAYGSTKQNANNYAGGLASTSSYKKPPTL